MPLAGPVLAELASTATALLLAAPLAPLPLPLVSNLLTLATNLRMVSPAEAALCLIVVVTVTFLSERYIPEVLVVEEVVAVPLVVEITTTMTQMVTECQLPVSRIQPTMVAGRVGVDLIDSMRQTAVVKIAAAGIRPMAMVLR